MFNVGLATTVPPIAAVYQTIVEPAGAVAAAVNVWIGDCSHSVTFGALATGATGASVIVNVTAVLVNEVQVEVPLFASA